MKRILFLIFFILAAINLNAQSNKKANTPEVGTLTAYYAIESFKVGYNEFKKGQLICDSNNSLTTIKDHNASYYKYENNEYEDGYSLLLPKSKVKKVVYKKNLLPATSIGNKAVFKSREGLVAKIFWSKINGHKYYKFDWDNHIYIVDNNMTFYYKECYVLSVEFIWEDGSKHYFEEQLMEKQGYINLNNGILSENWFNKEEWGFDKTAYSENGNLLVDQYEADGYPIDISISYIGELDALYINGKLFYRQ